MYNLGEQIVNGIFIGQGTVWNFLDLMYEKNLTDVVKYTKNNNFLRKNLKKNFDGGFTRKYEYGDINDETKYAIDYSTDFSDIPRTAPKGYGGSIGEIYSTPNENNSELKFLTEDNFLFLNNHIRKLSLLKRDKARYEKKTTENYFSKINDSNLGIGIPERNFGDYIEIKEGNGIKDKNFDDINSSARIYNLRQEETLKDGLKSERGFVSYNEDGDINEGGSYKGIISDNIISREHIGTEVKDRTYYERDSLDLTGDLRRIENQLYTDFNETLEDSDKTPESYKRVLYNGEENKTGLPNNQFGDKYQIRFVEKFKPQKERLSNIGAKARLFYTIESMALESKRGIKNTYDINGEPYSYHDFMPSSAFTYNIFDPRKKVSEKTYKKLIPLTDIADTKIEVLRGQHLGRIFYKNFIKKHVGGDGNNTPYNKSIRAEIDFRKRIYVVPDKENVLLFSDLSKNGSFVEGIYGYSKSIRDIYKSSLKGIKNPWDNKNLWSNTNSYGVSYNERGQEYYTVDGVGRPQYDGNAQISANFNGGKQSQYLPEEGKRTYYYYEEKEKSGVPNEINISVANGTSVSLTDHNSASRLLKKTNELFKEAKIQSLINRFHTDTKEGIYNELTTAFDPNFGLSRGRNLIKKTYEGKTSGDDSSGYDNPYCRTWTAHHQYSKLKDRIRPFVTDKGVEDIESTQSNFGELRPNNGGYRLNEYSVLRKDGFVRITPTHKEGRLYETPKNYMFSIENLAWRDITVDKNTNSLSAEQIGPNNGRIMWFPPYNLRFSENVNVNWNANTFIGRGEEIYTYTNTVRSGTLDFTLLIDHPSILNKWRGTSTDIQNKEEKERDILRFFAGCGNINDEVTPTLTVKEAEQKNIEEKPSVNPEPVFETKKIAYVIFFPNNFSGYDKNIEEAIEELENYNSGKPSTTSDEAYKDQILHPDNNTSNGISPTSGDIETIRTRLFGGDEKIEIKYFDELKSIESNFTGKQIFGYEAKNCELGDIETKGFASKHGKEEYNLELCKRRRTCIEKIIKHLSPNFDENNVNYNKQQGRIIEVPDVDGRGDINTFDAKIARAAYVIVNVKWKAENVAHEGTTVNGGTTVQGMNVDNVNITEPQKETTSNIKSETTITSNEYTYDNEYLYFSEIMGDEMVYKNIVDKVRYFDPAFHSITPEGFNARLTFLHQCTRQGPTNAISSGNVNKESESYLKFAGNLAFGRAPYCILRIGDFFNTKICIDSMSITYDNNGVQWDLNPEGAGVQPMYANISLSFKFIGGQDIVKPIERLQNAVTANYYANASIYSRHADNNKHYYDALEGTPKTK